METECRADAQLSDYAARVLEQVAVAPGCRLLTVSSPGLARAASPGQFALLGCGTGYDPFLRRPLSFHRVDLKRGEVSFLYRVKGVGTQWLAERRRGDVIPVLGPLGRGFRHSDRGKRGLLVGAGLGAAPLLFLAERLAGQAWSLTVLLGATTKTGILRADAFGRFGTVKTVTEDGSTPKKGTILDLLQEELNGGGWDTIYACGPRVVLKAVQEISARTGIPAQISVEERMACGLGACLGCACRSASSPGYLRVCREGPVFDAGEVILDD
ncbi:MAG TPA: dihydroorotate dehydrogenase electron transfer subunit [Syntrophomonadaceae bacterium]|nr:dihydroorotate dehydrogenase electron transfer subunit [Syntrophomonadaceae bacterium]